MLDEVERFMDGVDQSGHHIKERYVAARAVRHEANEVGKSVTVRAESA
jgi:hypothetical protein